VHLARGWKMSTSEFSGPPHQRTACIMRTMSENGSSPIGFAALFVILWVSGCGASATFIPTRIPPHPVAAHPPETVRILAAIPPQAAAVTIGRIEASSSVHSPIGDGKEEVFEELRRAAGENGCDSILLEAPEDSLFATSNGTPMYKTHQQAWCFVNR